jgi:pSer/pThr/pTyr-binding forkhead associated (FHA) protein
MPVTEWIERLGRAIFESPFGSQEISRETPELAEVRLAVLREVRARTHRVSGREVFPYNEVRICLRGVPPEHAGIFTGKFFAEFCTEELRAGLTKSGVRFPSDLGVEVETTTTLPLTGEQWLKVETATRPQLPAAPKRAARIIVLKGAANHTELALTKARTNIGRTADVYRTGGPSRRNDVAFDQSSEISRTVSREHAHITYSKKTGEYRLFNDRPGTGGARETCGLWIIRDGLSYEVHHGARGARLESGDEIHLGRAVVKFLYK